MSRDKVCLIQISRHGDLAACAIPVAYELHRQGKEVHLVTHKDFLDLPNACSYITTHAFDGSHRATAEAGIMARNLGFDNILYLQADGPANKPPYCTRNFQMEMWARSGMIDRFHDIPLVLDKLRDEEPFIPYDDGRKVLLLNLCGYSDPYRHMEQQLAWVVNRFSERYQIVDLTDQRFSSVTDIAPYLRRAVLLITVNTLTLHLSHVTEVPTIAFQGRCKSLSDVYAWGDSEPRRHWIYECSYEESVSDKNRREMEELVLGGNFTTGKLIGIPPTVPKLNDLVRHVTEYHDSDDYAENSRQNAAWDTWNHIAEKDKGYEISDHITLRSSPTSRDIGDSRSLPYVKDVIASGIRSNDAGNTILAISNDDACLIPSAITAIRRKLLRMDCCFSRRHNVDDIGLQLTAEDLMNAKPNHFGADLFAARIHWWKKHLPQFPNMFWATEGWDTIMRFIFYQSEPRSEMTPPIIWHVNHEPVWSKLENIKSTPSQIWNREKGKAFFLKHGLPNAIANTGDSAFLPYQMWMIPTE